MANLITDETIVELVTSEGAVEWTGTLVEFIEPNKEAFDDKWEAEVREGLATVGFFTEPQISGLDTVRLVGSTAF